MEEAEEVTSREWEPIEMSEQEQDLLRRMYRLVGDRWALIAGRLPGRTPESIERFWLTQQQRQEPCFGRKRRRINLRGDHATAIRDGSATIN